MKIKDIISVIVFALLVGAISLSCFSECPKQILVQNEKYGKKIVICE